MLASFQRFIWVAALLVALGLGMASNTPVQAQSPVLTVDTIAGKLVCQCGCGWVLNNCVHQECAVREQMTASIARQISQGRTEPEIIQSFVQQYGEKVLAAPTKKGFNLTAWITPFLAIVIGGVIIFLLLKAWVLKGSTTTPVPQRQATADPRDEEYRRRVEAELQKFGEGR